MNGYHHQACPICHANSFYRYSDRDKLFVCPNCTLFRISASAEKYMAGHIQSSAVNLTEQALNAPPGETLVIDLDTTSNRLAIDYVAVETMP